MQESPSETQRFAEKIQTRTLPGDGLAFSSMRFMPLTQQALFFVPVNTSFSILHPRDLFPAKLVCVFDRVIQLGNTASR